MTGLLRRIPRPVQVAVVLLWLGAALWDKSQTVNQRPTPLAVSIILWSGVPVVAAFGVIRFLRSWYAPDRPPFDPISRGWLIFVAITGTLLVLPVADLVRHDPKSSPPIEAVMFLVGLGLVGLVVQYARKPVWDESIPLNEFYGDDRRRVRSSKVSYGDGWRTATDAGGIYAVRWIEETQEICAFRGPLVPVWLRLAPESSASALLGAHSAVEFLGWAENREVLDRALSGWERQVDEPDSLAWARQQLDLAAAETERAK